MVSSTAMPVFSSLCSTRTPHRHCRAGYLPRSPVGNRYPNGSLMSVEAFAAAFAPNPGSCAEGTRSRLNPSPDHPPAVPHLARGVAPRVPLLRLALRTICGKSTLGKTGQFQYQVHRLLSSAVRLAAQLVVPVNPRLSLHTGAKVKLQAVSQGARVPSSWASARTKRCRRPAGCRSNVGGVHRHLHPPSFQAAGLQKTARTRSWRISWASCRVLLAKGRASNQSPTPPSTGYRSPPSAWLPGRRLATTVATRLGGTLSRPLPGQ